MSTPDHDCLDAETILNDLCASKINASISWIGDGGFHFVLGDPPQAEGWAFSTIGGAAISLRDEACAYYPGAGPGQPGKSGLDDRFRLRCLHRDSRAGGWG